MNFKQYPDYEKSEIEWIDEIPSHWEKERAKYLFKEISIKGFPEKTLLSVSKGKGLLPRDQLEFRTVMAMKDLHNFKLVQENQFVIHLRSFQSGFELSKIEGIVSPAYTVFEALNKEITEYFKYVFYSKLFIDYIASTTMSLRDGKPVSYKNFSSMFMPIPPLNEQRIIADFLDKELFKINLIIKKYGKLIELLKEKRIALISHVATKGLDENVEMKDSGVKWIGEIPEHWKVNKIKYTSPIFNEKITEKPKNLPYIGMENIESWTGELKLDKPIENVDSTMNIFYEENILFGKLRPYLAKSIVAPFEGVCSTELVTLKVENDNKYFIHFQIISKGFINTLDSYTYGVKMPRSSPKDIENMKICLPPIKEQNDIVAYLNKETSKTKELIKKIQSQITLLKEYKISLISHAVTGKIDVREQSLK